MRNEENDRAKERKKKDMKKRDKTQERGGTGNVGEGKNVFKMILFYHTNLNTRH